MDDELARELEQERQNILAATSNDLDSARVSYQESLDASLARDEDGSDIDDNIEDDHDSGVDNIPDEEDSDDEWQPPEPASRPARQSKRRRRQHSSEDSDDESGTQPSDLKEEPVPKKTKKAANSKSATPNKANGHGHNPRAVRADPSTTETSRVQEEDEDSFDEEAERVQAEVEAAAAWADVRRRKEAAASQPSANGSASQDAAKTQPGKQPSLTAWLGKGPSASSSVSELAASLPMPTTCPAAQIIDRNSLFIGYVYPLTSSSSAYISALLSHLTRVVHPSVPIELLPPQFANAPANKRGSSHDMYAYRVFELKRGRTGLGGPDDFSLQEDREDDGERWGGDRVLRVAREEGASDVLVVVSRWYGGELLGPVRFDHIENAARAALHQHMDSEEVDEFRQRIQFLDRKIAQAKAKLQGANPEQVTAGGAVSGYEDLTVDRAQRLWLARQKALDALQKRITLLSSQPEQDGSPTPPEEIPNGGGDPVQSDPNPGEAQLKPAPLDDAPLTIQLKPDPEPETIASARHPHLRVKQEQEQALEHQHALKTESTLALHPTPKPEPGTEDDLSNWDDLS